MACSAQGAVFLLFICFLKRGGCLNYRPIIGVVSEDTSDQEETYIAASYVKYIESAGAQVVPILSNTSDDQLMELFSYINGVLFPGGAVSVVSSNYSRVGNLAVQMAMKYYDSGDYFPVWGTCLGFELLSTIIGGDGVLSRVSAYNYSIPLNLTSAAESSRLFSLFPPPALEWIAHEPLTANYHNYGVTMESFRNNPKLTEFYDILSTNRDRNGIEFVSTIESKQYPVYAVQWHPEKNGFEWAPDQANDHSEHGIAIMQYTANFFVQEARKSSHKFPSKEMEQNALIYNYSPRYTPDTHFVQTYYF